MILILGMDKIPFYFPNWSRPSFLGGNQVNGLGLIPNHSFTGEAQLRV